MKLNAAAGSISSSRCVWFWISTRTPNVFPTSRWNAAATRTPRSSCVTTARPDIQNTLLEIGSRRTTGAGVAQPSTDDATTANKPETIGRYRMTAVTATVVPRENAGARHEVPSGERRLEASALQVRSVPHRHGREPTPPRSHRSRATAPMAVIAPSPRGGTESSSRACWDRRTSRRRSPDWRRRLTPVRRAPGVERGVCLRRARCMRRGAPSRPLRPRASRRNEPRPPVSKGRVTSTPKSIGIPASGRST